MAGSLYDIITDNQKHPTFVKILACDNIYLRTANTILTVYYSSYIDTVFLKETTNNSTKPMLYCYSTGQTYPTFFISIINSTRSVPRIMVDILKLNGQTDKRYEVTLDTPKVMIDLTADFAAVRSELADITSLQFLKSQNPERTADQFYQDCINILSNVFISYTYKD
jgi:hypothetical protein